jgi:hypothetical protein
MIWGRAMAADEAECALAYVHRKDLDSTRETVMIIVLRDGGRHTLVLQKWKK